MKRFIVVALLLGLVGLTGCEILKEQKINWDTCRQSEECKQGAEKWKETGEMVGTLAGSLVPGAAAPAQKGIGYLFLAIATLVGGHALRKKKESQPHG